MEMLKAPLERSLAYNKRDLALSEREQKNKIKPLGNPEGNRHERRVAARIARHRKETV